jgi:hypothetical protein
VIETFGRYQERLKGKRKKNIHQEKEPEDIEGNVREREREKGKGKKLPKTKGRRGKQET